MGREIRKVPSNWEHPKRDDGSYQPMFNKFYGDELNEWIEGNKQWENGTHKCLIDNPELKEKYPFYAMYYGDSPSVDFYQKTKWRDDELTHIQLYETTSEGTPKSPVFRLDEFEKLCEYAAENCTTFATFKATKEEWMQMLSNGFVYHKEVNAMFF